MDEIPLRTLSFFAAIVPPVIVLVYFLTAARIKVTGDKIWEGFGFGACAAFPVVVVVQIYEKSFGYGDGFFESSLNHAFFGAAIPEETFKLIALLTLISGQLHTLKPSQTFTLSIAVACGFACLENIFYVVDSDNWHFVALLRSISAVPGHAFVGALMGFFAAKATKGRNKIIYWALAAIVPILLHGLYDFPIFVISNFDQVVDGPPTEIAWFFVLMFILVVIIEGLFAHISLCHILKNSTPQRRGTIIEQQTVFYLRWLHNVAEHSFLWVFMGVISFSVAVIFLLGVDIEHVISRSFYKDSKYVLVLGFACFAMLHAFTFVGLAIVLRSRKKGITANFV
ncbi:PrsW family glutamic-type intramembrane protease [Sneathiella glossodoripedis]|uniref:PrsW family glutamic-type intramembrane protease n=1 Tax=Sneathiella glossodoripedis TaxID=418853 RepID=UPI0004722F9A|nr:PrsW family glutamic-type intramembrane protease [Sneathiella glossodoripedis]